MNRSLIALLCATVAVAAGIGVLVAIDTGEDDIPQPEAPFDEDAPFAPELLGSCSGTEPVCTSSSCSGPTCSQGNCNVGENTGWTTCCDSGQLLDCTGSVVIKQTCECTGGICAAPQAIHFYCS
jgi:hypothetical protein